MAGKEIIRVKPQETKKNIQHKEQKMKGIKKAFEDAGEYNSRYMIYKELEHSVYCVCSFRFVRYAM